MLKYILYLLFLNPLASNWHLVVNLAVLYSFIWLFSISHHSLIFNLSMNLGLDSISYIMILLSVWILVLTLYASQYILKDLKSEKMFIIVSILLTSSLVMAFSARDVIMFYIFFESTLIPTLILIIGWGYQPERIQAGVYMLFYTLGASLPLLVSLLVFYDIQGTSTFEHFSSLMNNNLISMTFYLALIFAFLVKLPMFFFHLWLPKAHVEAPVAGSMVLAGVLLKLGGYGLIRVLPIIMKINKNFSWVWVMIGLVGGSIVSIMCLRQTDMKSLIAYSSVAHMGLVLCGLILLNIWGWSGAITVMVGHGLCSSGLFYLANIVYMRTASRSLLINKGLLTIMPSMSFWWFLLSIGNMAAPPSINLLGEINLLSSIMSWNTLSLWSLSLLSFFSASYTIFLFTSSQHGLFFNSMYSFYSGKTQEFFTLFLHWMPLNILILKSSLFTLI